MNDQCVKDLEQQVATLKEAVRLLLESNSFLVFDEYGGETCVSCHVKLTYCFGCDPEPHAPGCALERVRRLVE